MHLSTDDLGLLARLNKAPDGQLLLRLLRAKLAVADEKLRSATGEEVYRAQGRALALAEMIGDIEHAQQKLNPPLRPVTSRTAYQG